MQNKYKLCIHGGAGTIEKQMLSEELEKQYTSALLLALEKGKNILKTNGSAMDAVMASVVELENCPLFNAGKGSVFNHLGKHEMDASIMNGANCTAGAIAGVQYIKNPILLANTVLEKSEHVLLAGEGAMEFAKIHKLTFETDDYFYSDYRYQQWEQLKNSNEFTLDHSEKKFGTVGAVALDNFGNLAAATSTGGMTNKQWGRVGDTPIIGAGTYANNQTCAVSCTGHGEMFIRNVVAYDVHCLMEYKNCSLQEATKIVVQEKLVKIGGEGGLIAIDALGNYSLEFNSAGMYRGFCDSDNVKVAIFA